MNRKRNTLLFLLGATVANILLMFFYFLTLSGIAGIFLPDRTGPLAVAVWIGLFLAALIAAWYSYRWMFRLISDRVPLERYFDPQIFKGKF